jgi:TonB-dependent starch-binding outer membrane protein SusC
LKNFLKITCFFLILCNSVYSQNERKISGVVLDNLEKKPIANVNIKIRNTGVGAVTGADGKFVYTIKSSKIETVVLEISSIGYEKKYLTVGNNSFFTIYLIEQKSDLEEVVVTSSYGTKKRKEESVGSIVTVKSSDLQVLQAAESFDKMLDGLAAGVQVTGSSNINSPVKINIRGQGSLTPLNGNLVGTSTQPLIIIDGVVMTEEAGFDNELFDGSGALTEQFKNPLSKISPEDIETLTILKDAAAVGIYGADAANGVILVTTKRSKSKKIDFNFSTQTGFSSPINRIKFLSGPQYFELKKEFNLSQGQSLAQATANAGSSTVNTDWFDLTSRDGSFQRYNFSTSFGINNWNFRFSLNTLFNNEPQIRNDFKRYGGNLNTGYSTKKFTIQLSLTPSLVVQNAPNTLSNYPLAPNLEAYNPDGTFALLGNAFGNPIAVANQNLNYTETLGIVGSINASYYITQKLKISTVLGIDYADKNQNRYFSGDNETGRLNGTFTVNNPDGTTTTYNNWGRRIDYNRNSFRWNQSTQLYYENTLGKHGFDGMIGLELQREKTDNARQSGRGYINYGPINNASTANSYTQNAYLSENAKRSVFSQFNYNYDKRFFFLLNVRRDESSAFGADVDAALNSGAGFSWNISSEKWMQNISWIDFLKFRASYGVTGNSRIGSYRALGLYFQDIQGFDGYNGNFFAYPTTAPNGNLSWERNYKSNLGIDFNIFQRFKFTVDVFRDNIKDIIVSRGAPPETGFKNIQLNGASMRNQGIEFSMSANWVKSKNFSWIMGFNISKISNVNTELKGFGEDYSASNRASAQKVGFSTSAIWGIRSAGIDPATGRELFLKNGQIYDGATYNLLFTQADWEVIGDTQPDFFGGIQNSFSFFKNITLSVRATYRYGGEDLIDSDFTNYRQIVNRNFSVNLLDRWKQQGDVAANPIVSENNPLFPNSTRFLYDTSHIKIQNINLSYSLPLKKMNIKIFDAASLFCDVSNVAYFYKQKSPTGKNGYAEYANPYPESRTLTFGFQANF